MGKAIHLILIGSISILSMTTYHISSNINQAKEKVVAYYAEKQSKNICNSMASMLMSTIADCTSLRVNTPQSKSLFNGTANYTVTNTLLTGIADSLIQISVQGIYFGDTSNVVSYIRKPSGGFIPAPVKAAISTNNPVTTLGNLVVDGRDHDLSGNLIPNNGTLGIWSTNTVSQSGSSTIGSTSSSGIDYSPQGSADGDTNIVQQNQIWPGGYPDSPDKVLGGVSNGYSDGTLKSIAQSGANGSQYVTDPSNLTFPLSGVTYVEIPPNSKPNKRTWNSAYINGSGVLVIHNSSTNAIIKNLNSGTFKGLIIADDIIHIHTTIIGAVVALSPSPSDGNCIGNGNGSVLFSRIAIENATGITGGGGGQGTNYGYGRQRLEVVYWYE